MRLGSNGSKRVGLPKERKTAKPREITLVHLLEKGPDLIASLRAQLQAAEFDDKAMANPF